MRRLTRALVVFVLSSSPAWAAGVGQVQVVDNELTAAVNVGGVFQASLKITFEQVIGLTPAALDLSALEVDPLDPALLSRLPDPSKISLPGQFPVVISVSPPAASNLTFTGIYEIELSTSNLAFHPGFRLYKAPLGGNFSDITDFSGVGSYRVRGSSNDFSDFLIVLDLRSKDVAVNAKFDDLQRALNAYAGRIDSGVVASLQAKLDSARQSYQVGLTVEAAADLEAFANQVKASSGGAIPDVYRANDPGAVNVAGALRSRAATLIFSIRA